MRDVLLHYHILKNAGTSVDAILRASFGARWREYDPVEALGHVASASHVIPYLAEHTEIRALSSHVMRPGTESTGDLTIYPIVFLRDPILRAASVYWFLRRTPSDDSTHWLAREFGFKEFVDMILVGAKHAHIRNHQTRFLSGWAECCRQHREAVSAEKIFERAMSSLGKLPAFGIVERFDESIEWLERWLAPVFPEITWQFAHEHRGRHEMTSRESIRAQLGEYTYAKLVALNRDDLRLYEEALRRFGC